jgi:hypothetical protein
MNRYLWRPATRLGWVAFVAVIVLTISTVTYAAGSILSTVYNLDPQFKALARGEELNLSQELNGYTVTLQQAYADDKSIIIGYTIDGSESARLAPYDLSLTDSSGRAFHPELGAGNASGTVGSAYAMVFNMDGQDTLPDQLKLHLSLSLVTTSPGAAPPPMIAPVKDGRISPSGSSYAVVAGPFNFDFTVSLHK